MSIRSKLVPSVVAVISMLATLSAHAGGNMTHDVPEPGTWALVGLAAAVGAWVSHKRRK